MVRFGIVGLGNMGSVHAQWLLEGKVKNACLQAVYDVDPERLARFPQVSQYSDMNKMFTSGEIDAVIVAIPHYDHIPVGIQALNAGLHLLCEKPLGVHVADCKKLLAAHKNKKQVFGLMLQSRTDSCYQTLRKFLRSGKLGHITRFNWIITTWFRSNAYYNSSSWRATWDGEGGGILVNQLPHDLDLIQWLFGLPQRVRAFCPIGKYHPIEVEDEINALFEYADGATGVLVATTGELPGTDRREVVGDKGRIVICDDHLEFTRTATSVSKFCRTTKDGFASIETTTEKIPFPKPRGASHVEVTQRFVDSILRGAELIATGEEGVAAVSLANAIIWSSLDDKTVTLPLDADGFARKLTKLRAQSRSNAKKKTPAKKKSGAAAANMAASFH